MDILPRLRYAHSSETRSSRPPLVIDYVPGAYVTHNQLHHRGGHQVTWAIDGVLFPKIVLLKASEGVSAPIVSHPRPQQREWTYYRASDTRIHQKRAPPALLS